jgi:amidase
MEQSDYGAYIDRDLHIKGAAEGPLKGYTVAIKDMYDVAGHRWEAI